MTPQEALQFLDNVLQQMSLNRAQHQQVLEAERIIEAAIGPKPEGP